MARAAWHSPPSGRPGFADGVQPKISTCSQLLAASTKRCRNSAQVIEPAKVPDGALVMLATFESSHESYAGHSGMRHNGPCSCRASPATSAAAVPSLLDKG